MYPVDSKTHSVCCDCAKLICNGICEPQKCPVVGNDRATVTATLVKGDEVANLSQDEHPRELKFLRSVLKSPSLLMRA